MNPHGFRTLFISQDGREFPYDGTQLRSLYAYLDHKVQGDSIVSWIGPCSISFDHMVDGEDVLQGATIAGDRMVHFIIELFHQPLFAAVAVQRLFASIVHDLLREKVGDPSRAAKFRRDGDDIFFGEGKLSISIATVSPVSALIHFAVNCTNEGTPVRTAALEELGLDPAKFAQEAMARFSREMVSVHEATVKVRWVK
jgi:hypothetical protein